MNATTETTTAPENTAPKAKAPVKMTLTSRAKMGAARKARPATKKAKAKSETLAKGVEKVKARNAAKANGKASIKQTVAKTRAANAKTHTRRTEACGKAAVDADAAEKALRTRKAKNVAAGIELRREPGTGWFRLYAHDAEVGIAFKTTVKGAVCWRAQEGGTRIKAGDDRKNAFGSSAAEAVELFARQLS
jgi:hypothetical protein